MSPRSTLAPHRAPHRDDALPADGWGDFRARPAEPFRPSKPIEAMKGWCVGAMPGDQIICEDSTGPVSFEASLIAQMCFRNKGVHRRRYTNVVRDLARVFDEVDLQRGVERNPRNRAIAAAWLGRALAEPGTPLSRATNSRPARRAG